MLSLGKLGPGQQEYYVEAVARGAEEYYTGAKEAPGQWLGCGAEQLGLDGEVDADELGRVLEHLHPDGTHKLTAARSVPVVAGFDATFCAPKSVSLLYALGEPEVSNQVRNAADAAIAASFDVLERAACRVRRGQGGHTVLDGDGFVAAAFRHRTSRAGDPHLHTHVVIGNLAHAAVDQKWSALDGRPLYSWLSPVGHLYEAQLRWELTSRLGVEWGQVRNGIADIAGIPPTALREFSTRRREMEAHLEKYGQHSARAAQLAAYATRRPKDTSIAAEGLGPVWCERAAACGLDTEALAAVVGQASLIEPPRPDSAAAHELYRWLGSAEGLTAQRSTFGERDVIKAVCNALPHGGHVDQVLDLVEGFLVSEHVVELRPGRDAATIRLGDGRVVGARTDESRWTTPELLGLEARLVDIARQGQASHVGVSARAVVDAVVEEQSTLTDEQAVMVRTICLSGDQVEIVEGVAGAGKTFALAAARQAWAASGYRVMGCSLAARAANQLERDAGIRAWTIDRLLGHLDRASAVLDAATVLVVDEAAMVGTRKLVRLMDHATTAGAKVVLVGDPCQLPEIDAGGAFRGLRARLGASDLIENRRQTALWERNALAELRDGDPDVAIDAYLDHDRIHVAANDGELRELMVEEWMNVRVDGGDVLMVAPRLADVDDLNQRARTLLRAEGYLGDDQVVIEGRGLAVGDDVLALRNDYRIGVLNGTRGVIDHIDPNQRVLMIEVDGGERCRVPFDYAEAGLLTHGYATTIHKAQGATVDRCLVLLDDTSAREHAYTALSRGRHCNDVFIIDPDRRVDEQHGPEVELEPIDLLRAVSGRCSRQQLALDQADAVPVNMLDQLRRERNVLQRRMGPGPPDRSREFRDLTRQHQTEQHYLDGARWRKDVAEKELDRFGPIGRRTHRHQRRELENRIARFDNEITRHETQLDRLGRAFETITPDVVDRAAWEHDHRDDLDQLAVIDRHIDRAEHLERALAQANDRSLDRGIDRGLGLEL